jgi:hypothetical protein
MSPQGDLKMNRFRVPAVVLVILGLASLLPRATQAYATYAKWPSATVVYYINPTNMDVSATAAEAAVQAGASAWSTQSSANFQFVYGGRVNDTSTGYDGRNVVVFRNALSGGALATTYSWWSGTTLVDADLVVWDGSYTFFTGTSGCSGGAYIEDITTHEFGHALGLEHSTVADATMYPTYNWCSTELRSLAADDIAAVESLYPPSGSTPSNTAPAVTIGAPKGGASFASGTTIAFSGSATDREDGSLTANIVWSSSLDGQLGFGGSLSSTLSVGSHVITASVTDSGGLASSTAVSISVTAAPTGPTLSAKGSKPKGRQQASLTWSGLSATTVDVFRNSAKISTGANSGSLTDILTSKGAGSYAYIVCGAGTSTCTNTATVVF